MIFHVFANRSNVGDWLSAMGIRSLLPAGAEVEELLCDTPFVERTMGRLATAGPEDLVVIGGGGLFMDYFRPFWEAFAPLAERVPFVVWGAGYVDLKREPSRLDPRFLRTVLERARVVAVRDPLTAEVLEVAGAVVAPCPSALAVPPPREPGHGVLHVANYTTAGPEAYEAMRAGAEAFARATGRPFRETNNRIEGDDRRGLETVLSLYARSDLVVSSRLHGCIIALAMGRPLVAVSGDRKIESALEDAAFAGPVLDATNLAPLGRAIESAAAAGAVPSRIVERARDANRAVADAIRRLLVHEVGT